MSLRGFSRHVTRTLMEYNSLVNKRRDLSVVFNDPLREPRSNRVQDRRNLVRSYGGCWITSNTLLRASTIGENFPRNLTRIQLLAYGIETNRATRVSIKLDDPVAGLRVDMRRCPRSTHAEIAAPRESHSPSSTSSTAGRVNAVFIRCRSYLCQLGTAI